MSRIGRKPITVPAEVEIKNENNLITVKGPKGELSRQVHNDMIVKIEDNILTVERPSDNKFHRSMHGLYRTLIDNMVIGVTKGYSKNLEIAGVGYRAAKAGNGINFTLGFSHPVVIEPPEGISFEVPAPTKITVSGISKEAVGAMAAKIRSLREPEPYKGKGVKYEGEVIRRKAGKAGGKGKK